MAKVTRKATKKREPTREEKREQLYADAKMAFAKLKKGEAITPREARILKRMHDTFLELYDVFKPSILSTLRSQGTQIDAMLEESEIEEEEDEDE